MIPPNVGLRSLTVRDVTDGDDWIEELLCITSDPNRSPPSTSEQLISDQEPTPEPRFPTLQHLSLRGVTLLTFPTLPLSHLAHVDLSHNLLNSLPSSLSSLPSLLSLNLSNNMITSLRNAPSTLGNISTLNLSHNRIDCLVGLERVLGLQRVDVRGNELPESGEVGRLAVLPGIKEIWCGGNPFDKENAEEWRVELGVDFRREGKEVTLDDQAWTWNEKRRIDGELAARGHASRGHSYTHQHNPATPHIHQPVPQNATPASTLGRSAIAPDHGDAVAGPSKPVSPGASAVGHKKRRPRRVINLDSEISVPQTTTLAGGSLPLPSKSTTEDLAEALRDGGVEGNTEIGGMENTKVKQKILRRAWASESEPDAKELEGLRIGNAHGTGEPDLQDANKSRNR